jgi:hypothetical protein
MADDRTNCGRQDRNGINLRNTAQKDGPSAEAVKQESKRVPKMTRTNAVRST